MDETARIIAELTKQTQSFLVANVMSVNSRTNTVSVNIRGENFALRCSRAYLDRTEGDQVLVLVQPGQMIVLGPVGSAYPVPSTGAETISDLSPPSGVGWQEIVTGSIWVRQLVAGTAIEKWFKRLGPYTPPPPSPSSPAVLVRNAERSETYVGGSLTPYGYATQGDAGDGLRTGVFIFGSGAWAPLSGMTIQRTRLTIQRRSALHQPTSPVPVHMWLHDAAEISASTPTLIGPEYVINLSLGQEWTGNVPEDWGAKLESGIAEGIALFTTNPNETAEAETELTVYVDYS